MGVDTFGQHCYARERTAPSRRSTWSWPHFLSAFVTILRILHFPGLHPIANRNSLNFLSSSNQDQLLTLFQNKDWLQIRSVSWGHYFWHLRNIDPSPDIDHLAEKVVLHAIDDFIGSAVILAAGVHGIVLHSPSRLMRSERCFWANWGILDLEVRTVLKGGSTEKRSMS
jgi:hypothetical protein